MAAAADTTGIRLSAHPRARRHITTAKAWGGLGAFALVAWLSHRAGLPFADLLWRSLLGGIVGYVAGWAIAVAVWRQLALAQIEDLRRQLIAQAETREAARKRETEEAAAAALAQAGTG
jgi:uncharacterized membrane protein YccC